MFLATASREGQPYVQHRGGRKGFLRVLDETTLGFVDFVGNRQFITLGNLAENPRAQLFLIDYATRRRVKIWGKARVVEGDDALMATLTPQGYRARPSQAILFAVKAWDANCPQHIPLNSRRPTSPQRSPDATRTPDRARSAAASATRADPHAGKHPPKAARRRSGPLTRIVRVTSARTIETSPARKRSQVAPSAVTGRSASP